MRQVLLITFGVIMGISLLAFGLTFFQVQQERFALSADLQYRTRILAESLNESIEPAYANYATNTLNRITTSFAGRERLVGVSIYDTAGNSVIRPDDIPEELDFGRLIERAIATDQPNGEFVSQNGRSFYMHAYPLQRDSAIAGAFVLVQDASYIDVSLQGKWWNNLMGVLAYLLVFSLAIAAIVRWVIFKPLTTLVESIRSARSGRGAVSETHHNMFFRPLASEIGKLTSSLREARTAASEEARMRLEKLDTPWTAERLKEFVKARLKKRSIIVVSNRGSHMPKKTKNGVDYVPVAGGMTTALTSIMEACGGIWFACGKEAEADIAGENGKLQMPPDEPKYLLKQVLLSDEDARGHYAFSAEAMYPLCLITHTRPTFKKEDWMVYSRVNGKFAEEILREIANIPDPLILINDYHFALLPRMLKKSRPDARVGLFWHVPWPNEESFSICPWRKEIVQGMLGADVIGFNTQQFCNYFMDTVSKEIESLIDWEQFSVSRDGHATLVKPFPVSISFTNGVHEGGVPDRAILEKLRIRTKYVGIGVDRLDYTKGIPERLKALEVFFENNAKFRGQFTFLQIAAPHREHIEAYRRYRDTIVSEVERINEKFGTDEWKPIVLELTQYSHATLKSLYQLANVCLVTSLHDSMNLVAKEYVAERHNEDGVLILSRFAGASRDLNGALLINPYSAEETGEAVHRALTMSLTEQHRRMKTMRDSVKDYNIYRWGAELIRSLSSFAS